MKGDNRRPPEAEIGPERSPPSIALALDHHSNDPPASAGWIDDKKQPVPVAVPPGPQNFDLSLCQLS
jgi:hypothetical protein